METSRTHAPGLLREYAVTLIEEECARRARQHRIPELVPLRELQLILVEDFKEILRILCREHFLEWHPDLNKRPMFTLARPEEST